MNLVQTLRIAWQALFRNKLRSFLTMLGIVIGVFAVIAMVAVGEGAQAVVQKTFSSMGSNMLVVMSGASKQGGAFGGFGSLPTLTWDDLKAIQREIPSVRYTSAVLHTGAQLQSDDRNWNTSVNGVSPDYFDIRDWPIASGLCFTSSDVDGGRKVAVLGQTVVDHLFGIGTASQRRGSRCRARTMMTRSSSPTRLFNPRFRAGCRSTSRARS
jgi:putative ABC transport system permease protein